MKVRVIYDDEAVISAVAASQGVSYTTVNVLVDDADRAAMMLEYAGIDITMLNEFLNQSEPEREDLPET